MTTILAPTIADSIAANAPRLHTQRWTYPKFVHQELLRHRTIYFMDFLRAEFDADFSFSVSSSRAIPFTRLLAEVRDDATRAAPVKWGAEQRGMSPGDEISDEKMHHSTFLGDFSERDVARSLWRAAALEAARIAESMAEIGVHKSIVNRIIEPYVHVHCLATATEPGWMNFFGLRLDQAADPTLRALAEASWRSWNESTPRTLQPGEWHLPFVDEEYTDQIHTILADRMLQNIHGAASDSWWDFGRRVSTACCAHLSYESFDNPASV